MAAVLLQVLLKVSKFSFHVQVKVWTFKSMENIGKG